MTSSSFTDSYGDELRLYFTSPSTPDIPNHILITCTHDDEMATVAFDLDDLGKVIQAMQEIHGILEARMRGDK